MQVNKCETTFSLSIVFTVEIYKWNNEMLAIMRHRKTIERTGLVRSHSGLKVSSCF